MAKGVEIAFLFHFLLKGTFNFVITRTCVRFFSVEGFSILFFTLPGVHSIFFFGNLGDSNPNGARFLENFFGLLEQSQTQYALGEGVSEVEYANLFAALMNGIGLMLFDRGEFSFLGEML